MRRLQQVALVWTVRRSAFWVGCWCGSLQLGLTYGLSFFWSATPATAVYVLLGWLSGSLWGTYSSRVFPRHSWVAPLLPVAFLGFGTNIPLWIVSLSSVLAGRVAGHWLILRESVFVEVLRWESLGMGIGYLVTGLTTYRGTQTLMLWCLMVTSVLVWREERWRCAKELSR